MGDFSSILGNALGTLTNTAATFGAGAIATSISGNPLYSNDPAAIGFASGSLPTNTLNGATGTVAAGSSGILLLIIVAFLFFKAEK